MRRLRTGDSPGLNSGCQGRSVVPRQLPREAIAYPITSPYRARLRGSVHDGACAAVCTTFRYSGVRSA
eukprot:800319-Alexandrium_andersonii.AAC.1